MGALHPMSVGERVRDRRDQPTDESIHHLFHSSFYCSFRRGARARREMQHQFVCFARVPGERGQGARGKVGRRERSAILSCIAIFIDFLCGFIYIEFLILH